MKFIHAAFEDMEGVVCARVALEAENINDHVEDEITIYAKIGNVEGLSEASLIEQHEQAEIKTPAGKFRIRKTTINGRLPTYSLTSKRPIESNGTFKNRERTKNINEELYNIIIDICPNFMSKARYVFKAEQLHIKRKTLDAVIKTNELSFEVDVFTKADGTISKWCKIDVEVNKIADILRENNVTVENIKLIANISKLPFLPDNIVIDSKDNKDQDKQALIRALYQKEFLIARDLN